jgi:23S rRNA pseudouridine1911/1915/1917 synthase
MTLADLTRKESDVEMVLERQALHAQRIQFAHPVSGKAMEVVAELPADLQRTLEVLREHRVSS